MYHLSCLLRLVPQIFHSGEHWISPPSAGRFTDLPVSLPCTTVLKTVFSIVLLSKYLVRSSLILFCRVLSCSPTPWSTSQFVIFSFPLCTISLSAMPYFSESLSLIHRLSSTLLSISAIIQLSSNAFSFALYYSPLGMLFRLLLLPLSSIDSMFLQYSLSSPFPLSLSLSSIILSNFAATCVVSSMGSSLFCLSFALTFHSTFFLVLAENLQWTTCDHCCSRQMGMCGRLKYGVSVSMIN